MDVIGPSEVIISPNSKLIAVLVLACAGVSAQEYSGPQILSRGSGTGDRIGRPATGFQYYAGVSGGYETGLIPASVDSQGNIYDPGGLFSIWANFGAYGRHSWRHTEFGLDYTGNVRHYSDVSSYDGSDHTLGIQLTHQHSRRLLLEMRANGGIVSHYYMNALSNVTDILTPANYALFDSRAYFLQLNAGMTYQVNARLSFSASGDGFGVRYRSNSLVGLGGYGAQGSMTYRLNRRRSLNASYRYTHIDYVHGFGESNMHIYFAGLSQQIGRRWQFSIQGGASQIEAIGLESVASDPLTEALFGPSTTVEAFHRNLIMGAGHADLTGRFKNSQFSAVYNQMPTPGNGIYLTSWMTTAQGSYRYLGIRKFSVGAFAGYTRVSGFGQEALGKTWYNNAGADVSYKVVRNLEAILRFDARRMQIDQTTGFNRLGYLVSVGLNWHPGEIPLAIW